MSLFKKKAIVIEAFQWTGGEDQKEDPEWACEAIERGDVFFTDTIPRLLVIKTLEGEMKATPGDYIIKGIKGEIYPCKEDIFNETYEKVN